MDFLNCKERQALEDEQVHQSKTFRHRFNFLGYQERQVLSFPSDRHNLTIHLPLFSFILFAKFQAMANIQDFLF